MINFTAIARMFLARRVAAAHTWRGPNITAVQLKQLRRLTKYGASTAYGRRYGMRPGVDYTDFTARVPVVTYNDIQPYVMKMVAGEKDILWPGECLRFAQSSGTSDGRSKYIPVTGHSLQWNHFRGAGDAVAHYLALYPDSRMFSGKGFILGGSFANNLHPRPGVKIGDLSAHLIDGVSPLVETFRVPSRDVALLEDWNLKVPMLVRTSANRDITNISGVPSWFMTVIKEVLKYTGASNIHEVWPNLEVFFHGGISMEPYRAAYAALTDDKRMRYHETYNASEGFFAVQNRREPGSMLLLLDAGVFYEFLPLDSLGDPHPRNIVPAWQVEEGSEYALIITAPNGLWRYMIGDVVRIVRTDPLEITITGRTGHYINAFGEEVMVHNTDAALAAALNECGGAVANYTVAPVFADSGEKKGRHQWLVEWDTKPADTVAFARALDAALRRVNSDYDAKRTGDIFLDPLSITDVPAGTFDLWLASTGKLGGQRKVPRLSNDRRIADAILHLIS